MLIDDIQMIILWVHKLSMHLHVHTTHLQVKSGDRYIDNPRGNKERFNVLLFQKNVPEFSIGRFDVISSLQCIKSCLADMHLAA